MNSLVNRTAPLDYLEHEPATLIRHLLSKDRRVLLFGQPGIGKTTLAAELATHVEGFIGGIHWDRIGKRGPLFDVAELHGAVLKR